MNTKEILEEYKENSKYCYLCRWIGDKKESMFDGCQIQIVSITESGKLVKPYDTQLEGMTAMLPMCAYHFILSQEGVLATTTKGEIIQSKILADLEPQSDDTLKRLILRLERSGKDKKNMAIKLVAKTLINARKFQKEFDEELEKAREKKK